MNDDNSRPNFEAQSREFYPQPPKKNDFPWKPLAIASWICTVAAVLALSVNSETRDTPEAAPVQEAAAPTQPAPKTTTTKTQDIPKPEEFKIELNQISNKCFGSAGCSSRYQLQPKYTGASAANLRPATVTYQVTGGDSGPETDSFEIEGYGGNIRVRDLSFSAPQGVEPTVSVTKVTPRSY